MDRGGQGRPKLFPILTENRLNVTWLLYLNGQSLLRASKEKRKSIRLWMMHKDFCRLFSNVECAAE